MKFRPKKSKAERLTSIPWPEEDLSDVEDEDIEPNHLDAHNPEPKYRCRDVLRLHLHHGDILIQQGAGLQKYYEVCI